MAIKLITLNIEGDKHIHRFLPVLKQHKADVICFQELFEIDCSWIAAELGMTQFKYVPTVKIEHENKYGIAPKGNWGIALMTKLPVSAWNIDYYSDFNELKTFNEPNDNVRSVLFANLGDGEKEYRIATTHFTWSPGGKTTDLQRQDFARLKTILSQYQDLVICGDFNAPRGQEMFSLFEELFTDNVPKEITTTIDPTLHYAGHKNLQFVVDTIFSTPQYRVSNVQIVSGVSDHMGVMGMVEKL